MNKNAAAFLTLLILGGVLLGAALPVGAEAPKEGFNLPGLPFLDKEGVQQETSVPAGTGGEILDLVATVSNWVFAIFLAISIIYLLMAAFQFVTGGPASVDEARQKLILAAVGIGIALIALGIPRILRTIITGATGDSSGT